MVGLYARECRDRWRLLQPVSEEPAVGVLSETASLKILILPAGAINGPRIILNGITGKIELYNAANILVGEWDPTSLDVINPNNGSRVTLDPNTFGVAAIRFDPPDSPGIGNYNTATILSNYVLTDETPYLALFSPQVPGDTSSRITLYGENSVIPAPPRITLSPNDGGGTGGFIELIQPGDFTTDLLITWPGGTTTSFPRGAITGKGFVSLANSIGYTADTDTDFAINNLPVIAGRTTRFFFASRYTISAAGSWALEFKANGTKVDEVGFIDAAAAQTGYVSGWADWTAPTTQATDDFVVTANELAGASTLTFIGAGNTPRSLKPSDAGIE